MTKSKWAFNIQEDLKRNGQYKCSFDKVIYTLATILEQRDKVLDAFLSSGEEYVIKGRKNPHITLWDDLNKTALAYWKELGLTPASLRRIDEGALKVKQVSSLEEVLSSLEA